MPATGPAVPSGGVDDTVRIYVLSNGFHSDIAVPAGNGVLDRLGLEIGDFPVDPARVRYWALGWGSRVAYTSLEKVADLTPAIMLKALAFDKTVMHVQPLGPVSPGEHSYAYDISQEAFRKLLDDLAGSFRRSKQPIPVITQGFGDRFYHGRGRFSPWRSCNAWTGSQLRAIGIGVGVWTPFAQSLEFGLARTAAQARSTR